ncbi:hypothetical protein HYV83_02750 [Candidatus Woesearchaeota archaeon]|nr:hypothetical protein [Candidatus Woesearchaeota archaeon]
MVVDSSVLIPLLNIGKLSLLISCFKGKSIIIPEVAWNEVVEDGKALGKSVSALEENKSKFRITGVQEKEMLKLEGLEKADLAVISLAKGQNNILLTNDATLYNVAITQNIKVWWLTALIFYAVKSNVVSSQEGKNILLELVSAGTYLKSEILAQALLTLEKLGKNKNDRDD